MASTKRERELARLRAERQAARRAEEAARKRRRNAVVASTLAVVLVAAVVVAIGLNRSPSTTASPTASPSAPAAGGPCTYTKTGQASRPVELPPATPTATTPTRATLATTQGDIAFTLDTEKAPCTSGALISLAAQKFYDGTPCHRLTTDNIFVLQCGDPTGTGSGGPGYQYAEENLSGATYPKGTVAMAKTAAPGTTGSQFFLVYKDTPLPPQYTPVGKITAGLDVVEKVAAAGAEPAGDGKPKLPLTITTFTTGPLTAVSPTPTP